MCASAIVVVVAQDASPAAGSASGSTCTVAPRSADELATLWFGAEGTPPAAPPGHPPAQSAADLPKGEPADEQTAAAVSATLHEVFACFDAGQYARAFALTTDNATMQFGPDLSDPSEDSPEEVVAHLEGQIAGTPIAGEETGQQTFISEPREARVLDDGRVGAIFESNGETIFALFEQRGDWWLLDDFIFVMGPGATPTS
jgi:hypothetical protein